MLVGENLRLLREKKKVTQAELAKSIGVSRQAICMWEKNKREIGLSALNKIAEVLDVPIHRIIGGVNMAKKNEKKVKFELKAPTATSVALSGDFNNWDSKGLALKKKRDGSWSIELSLKPGRYEYKFIVDGEWKLDPENKLRSPNPFGTENSVKEVR